MGRKVTFQGLTLGDWVWRARGHLALYMRKAADKVAPDTTWRYTGLKMRMVKGQGVRVSWASIGAPGTMLWYREEDYEDKWDDNGEEFDG